MSTEMELVPPAILPPLDDQFRPASLANRRFREAAHCSGRRVPLRLALERADGSVSRFDTEVFGEGSDQFAANLPYAERLVKFLLWQRGGWRVIVGGPAAIGAHVAQVYSPTGARAFDYDFMGGVYEHTFTVETVDADQVPAAKETTVPLGRHLDGCRIGFDLGASDRKVSAVKDGEVVFSDEVVWDPRNQSDPEYHYAGIRHSLQEAAKHLPRVDAIGGSAAGVYINNRPRVASLYRGVPKDAFEARIAPMFLNLQQEFGGVPFDVVNDGEVTALAGAMSLEDSPVLGIALGSSEAGGYVTPEGNITGWLNELAFCPVDYHPEAPVDEWSGDRGCGVQYFCQTGAIRLAPAAGIELDPKLSPADKLVVIQEKLQAGHEGAVKILESIGVWMGYALAHYADFYEMKHVLILGRVTSAGGGEIILEQAQRVLAQEFPALQQQIELHLPDERLRRVGQAIAAASLPAIPA